MNSHELAWKLIEYWIEKDYGGNEYMAVYEMGDLDELALSISRVIDDKGLIDDQDDMIFLGSQIEAELF